MPNPLAAVPRTRRGVQSYRVDHNAALAVAGAKGVQEEKMKAHAGVVDELAQVLASRRGEISASAATTGDINARLAERAKMMKAKQQRKFE